MINGGHHVTINIWIINICLCLLLRRQQFILRKRIELVTPLIEFIHILDERHSVRFEDPNLWFNFWFYFLVKWESFLLIIMAIHVTVVNFLVNLLLDALDQRVKLSDWYVLSFIDSSDLAKNFVDLIVLDWSYNWTKRLLESFLLSL